MMTVFWVDSRICVIIYARGYAMIRQRIVESSAIHSDLRKTLVYSNAELNASSEKLPLLSVKAVIPIITRGIIVKTSIQTR